MNRMMLCLILLAAAAICGVAQEQDESQAELRLNPEIEADSSAVASHDYSSYTFLNTGENRIELNGDDWTGLAERFAAAAAGDSVFSMVYLGDSHIQADFGGAVVRRRMAEAAHGAGRGIIIPFKLASTNQPNDYTFRIRSEYVASKLLKMPWATEMPFTGIGVQPLGREFTVDISCATPFDKVRFFYRGAAPDIIAVTTEGDTIEVVHAETENGILAIGLPETVDELSVTFSRRGALTLAGAELSFAAAGTFVHSVGNNGATYSSYGLIDNFGGELSGLSPDLIVIALGTNEAFSRIDSENMINNIDNLVRAIRRRNPAARLLLVTPSECYRKVYTRRRKGRRRTATTVVNTKVAQIRGDILSYARKAGIPVYDMYAVAGGAGAAAEMRKAKVLSTDGVHFTAQGYRLWGNLLADAIISNLTAN